VIRLHDPQAARGMARNGHAGVRGWQGCLLGLLLAGCASTADTSGAPVDGDDISTGVGQRMIMPAGATRYELAPHQGFSLPQFLATDAPGFPARYRPASPFEVSICASLVVSEDGSVRDVRVVDAPGCVAAGEAPEPLAEAVRSAMASWQFRPAMMCEYAHAATRNRSWTGNGCSGPVQAARPVPVTLSWAFTFELRDGQARVTRNPAAAN